MAPEAVAELLAGALGMDVSRDQGGKVYVGRPLAGGARIGGEVHANGFADPRPAPDEISVLDGYDTV